MQISNLNTAASLAGLARAQTAQGADADQQLDSRLNAQNNPAGKASGVEAVEGGQETTDRDGNGQTGYESHDRPAAKAPPANDAPQSLPPPDLQGRGAQLDLQA